MFCDNPECMTYYKKKFSGGGSSGVKVINLDDYGITNIIGGLFFDGGGKANMDDVGDFWADVNTEDPIMLTFSFFGTFQVCTSNITTVRGVGENYVAQVCNQFIIDYGGSIYQGAMMLINHLSSTEVIFKLDVTGVE